MVLQSLAGLGSVEQSPGLGFLKSQPGSVLVITIPHVTRGPTVQLSVVR
jgi:hypothetical protein